MAQEVLKLDPKDNVLIALRDLHKGEQVRFSEETFTLTTDVPAKHKFLVEDIASGADIVMYGVLVGRARQPIQKGEIVSTRNTSHEAAAFGREWREYHWKHPDVSGWKGRTFGGFRRPDGQVGTRNYWLVVPLVFCENRNILALKHAFEEELGFATPSAYRRQVAEMARLYADGKIADIKSYSPEKVTGGFARQRMFGNIDGIKFLLHEGGCGCSREDARNLCGLLAGYLHHPNVAGATVLSLGCQHAQVDLLREQIHLRNPQFSKPLFIFEQQQSGSEFKMLSDAIQATFSGLIEANSATRQPVGLQEMCVGLKCGGSDGFSGLSANPAVGRTADLIAALGGRTILSEFPELCGVEQELIYRCQTPEVGERFVQLMQDYAARAKAVRSGFEMNPSPGNIRDGLITDAMKSAGAARKGGSSPVTAVLDYPEYSVEPGLNLQCTPGSDVECVTAQVGAGAKVVLFTTGLGTPTGNPICPVVKISSNSRLAERMPDIVDIDTGGIIAGEKTVDEMGEEILELVTKVASGEIRTKAELLGQDDFIPWKRGVSL